jgi:arylsulfatase A-like enzyme
MSMGALFTGRTPSLESGREGQALQWNGRTWCGLMRFSDPNGELGCIPRGLPVLGEVLRHAGYWTVGIVTNQLLFRPAGFDRGFDIWVEQTDPQAPSLGSFGGLKIRRSASARDVNATLEDILKTRPSNRFFLYLHYMDVHDYVFRKTPYAEMVRDLDRAIGELMTILDDEGLLEDAAIIFTSDHGERLEEQHLVKGDPGHLGNPSFEEVLEVPLIVVSPGQLRNVRSGLRGQDVFGLITEIAGAPVNIPQELQPDELFVSEMHWRTYVKGHWKSYQNRADDTLYLVDLDTDPDEKLNVREQFPRVAADHRKRTTALSRRLGAPNPAASNLTAEDRRRLEALGYLE